jgi:cytidine deaminase
VELVQAAVELLRRRYDRVRHGVAAAVRTRSGRIFLGVNIGGIHTPCAEPVAIGAAITAGEPSLVAMVAVCRAGRTYPILPPCGTCRQLLFDYAPRAYFLVKGKRKGVRRIRADEGLPAAFSTF